MSKYFVGKSRMLKIVTAKKPHKRTKNVDFCRMRGGNNKTAIKEPIYLDAWIEYVS